MNEVRARAGGAALLFLLVVAAAAGAAGGAASAGGGGVGGGLGVPGWAGSAVVAFVAAGGTWLAYGLLASLFRSRPRRRRWAVMKQPWWAWLVEGAVVALLVALLIGLLDLAAHGKVRGARPPLLGGLHGAPAALPHAAASSSGSSIGWVPVVAGAVAALAAVVAYRFLRRRRARLAPMERAAAEREAFQQKRREAAAVLELSLDALYAEPDPKKAIIAAYARMDGWLAHTGFGRRPSEAPFEHLDRVMGSLGATAAVGAQLADLFERAKFDRRPCGPEMKQAALGALVRLRDELVAPHQGLAPA